MGKPLEPLPPKVVVLTFDDSVKSQATVVAPLLKELGFSATFFITEGFDFKTNKTDSIVGETQTTSGPRSDWGCNNPDGPAVLGRPGPRCSHNKRHDW